MRIISSLTDIRAYVASVYSRDLSLDDYESISRAIQAADHPPYGTDWSEWLERFDAAAAVQESHP